MTKKSQRLRAGSRSGLQWKVLRGLHIRNVERTCEEWTGRGWSVFAILGPLGNIAIVLNRMLAAV